MSILLTILTILVCVLLGIIVLIQNPKGGGLGSGFGNVNQIGGVKRTADFLEKATWTLAITLVMLCLVSTYNLGSLKSDLEIPVTNEVTAPSGAETTTP
jgi:preprotein translocase subunit SecG